MRYCIVLKSDVFLHVNNIDFNILQNDLTLWNALSLQSSLNNRMKYAAAFDFS